MHCGDYATANAQLGELLVLVEEKGALFWKGPVMLYVAANLVLLGKFADAVRIFDSSIKPYRWTGATLSVPYLSVIFLREPMRSLASWMKPGAALTKR